MSAVDAGQIDGLSFFQGFAYPDLELLCGYLQPRSVAAGEVIFTEGEPGEDMLILLSGRVAVHKGGERGQHLLSYEGHGRVIGDMALLDREPRSATCLADSACELLSLKAASLERMASEHPALAFRFMRALAGMLSRRLRRTSGVLAEYLVG